MGHKNVNENAHVTNNSPIFPQLYVNHIIVLFLRKYSNFWL